jgi:hypothetical protein
VHAERIYRIDAGTSAYSMLLPNADALFDGGPDVDGAVADDLPEDQVLALAGPVEVVAA